MAKALRIAYVMAPAAIKESAVQRKVLSQIQGLCDSGADARGFFFVTDNGYEPSTLVGAEFIILPQLKGRWFKSIRQFHACHSAAFQFIVERKDDFDIVFYRYAGASYFLWKISVLFKKRCVFEHVTSELCERRLFLKERNGRSLPVFIIQAFEYYYSFLINEWCFGGAIRRNALFGLCNSQEISNYQRSRTSARYETMVSGDSVNPREFELSGAPFTGVNFNFIFLKGSSSLHDYNGIDRILYGMVRYNGPYELKFYLFGSQLERERNMIKYLGLEESVHCGVEVDRVAQKNLFLEVHLGVSALAVHRKGIRSTTTIKSREYFAQGIPFIYAYEDPDVEDNSGFALRLPSDDSPIDFDSVIEWRLKLEETKPNFREDMRAFAESNLSYTKKMSRIYNKIKIMTDKS